jgi:hypothetical protein
LRRTWEKLIVAYFEMISQHLPGGTEENCDKPQDSWPRFQIRNFQLQIRSVNHSAMIIVVVSEIVCKEI